MERTTKQYKPKKGEKKWKKVGGGSIHLVNRIIKPGEVFWMKEEDLPTAFLDMFELLEDPTAEQEEEEPEPEKYKLVKNEEASKANKFFYDIVDAEGNVVSEEPLPKKEADVTLTELLAKK